MTRFRWVDRLYARLDFWFTHGRCPNTKRPASFTDHMMRLRLSDEIRSPLRCLATDKEQMKAYVAEILGPGHAVLEPDADPADLFAPLREARH